MTRFYPRIIQRMLFTSIVFHTVNNENLSNVNETIKVVLLIRNIPD